VTPQSLLQISRPRKHHGKGDDVVGMSSGDVSIAGGTTGIRVQQTNTRKQSMMF
jgi:hypothetical protein